MEQEETERAERMVQFLAAELTSAVKCEWNYVHMK